MSTGVESSCVALVLNIHKAYTSEGGQQTAAILFVKLGSLTKDVKDKLLCKEALHNERY